MPLITMKAFTAVFLISLMFSISILASPVKAQEPFNLTITTYGTIEPNTDLLERNGTTYTFKGDIFGTITIQKSGITIDGAGYTLRGQGWMGINLVNQEAQTFYKAVLVKNLRLFNFSEGIYAVGSANNSFVGNFFENARIHLIGSSNRSGDIIKHNVFSDSEIFVDYGAGARDAIVENNFFNSHIFVSIAHAPFVDRNYWSNYTAKYPNASELAGLGIWDTPYMDELYGATNTSIDYHPLVNPVTDFEVPAFGLPVSTPTPLPTATPISSSNALAVNPTIIAALAGLGVVVVVAVVIAKKYSKPKLDQHSG